MGGMLTSIRDLSRYVGGVPRRVAAARWPGDRPHPPSVAARDAAAVAPAAMRVVLRQGDQRART